MGFVEHHSGLPLLRVYWYDAGRGGAPAKDHLEIAELPNVKLRLGRLVERHNRLEQKGVDSLIVRDLMTLARERAIATAYLFAGDEDLREGVAAAQDMGVRVVLVGVPGDEANQAVTLVQEADELILVEQKILADHLRLAATEERGGASDEELAAQLGRSFARACSESLTGEQLGALLTAYPRIPAEMDAQMLRDAARALGDLRDRFPLKRELRAAFWEGISEAAAGGGSVVASSV